MRKLYKIPVSESEYKDILSGAKRTLLVQDLGQKQFDTLQITTDTSAADGSILDTIRPSDAETIADGMVVLLLGSNWEEEDETD